MNAISPYSWAQVALYLQQQPPGTLVRLHASQVEHPLDAGMSQSLGMPTGQRADYRLDVSDDWRLAVLDFGIHYDAWLESIVKRSALENALRESPGSTVMGATALGALLGLAVGRSERSALTGAVIGGLAALTGVAVSNAEDRPRTAHTALAVAGSWTRGSSPTSAKAPRKTLSPSRSSSPSSAKAPRKPISLPRGSTPSSAKTPRKPINSPRGGKR